jgi:hypothetical protein
MGQPIPAQNPSVVLRSHFKLVKGLLTIAMVGVLALSVALLIVANDDQTSLATKATPHGQAQAQLPAGTRFDGGPDEGTRGLSVQPQQLPAGTRFDGGPDEGTRGPQQSYSESPLRSYQPAPADSAQERVGGPGMMLIPQGPGAR